MVTVATALASAAGRVVLAAMANPSAGAPRGEPGLLGEVAAVGVAVAPALCSHGGERRDKPIKTCDSRVSLDLKEALQPLWLSLTLASVGLPAAHVCRPPRPVVVKRGALLTVVARGVVSTLTPAKHLEDTSGHPQLLYFHALQQTCTLALVCKP